MGSSLTAVLERSHASRPTESSSRQRLAWFVGCLYLLGLAAVSFAAAPEHIMLVPAQEDTAFLMLADGRRIDAVFEWEYTNGTGKFVLKEAAGTEQERPVSLGAGDILEATLHYLPPHYLPPSKEPLTAMRVELTLFREDPRPEYQGTATVVEVLDESESSMLPREAGELMVFEPFRLTAPTDFDPEIQSRAYGWCLAVHFFPDHPQSLLMSLTIDFPAADSHLLGSLEIKPSL